MGAVIVFLAARSGFGHELAQRIETRGGAVARMQQALKEHQVTVLFVEHDMDVVRRYVSRILAFYSGEVLADGPPQTVLANARVQELVTGGQRAHKEATA